MVLSDMVDEGLEGVVVLFTYVTLVSDITMDCLMFQDMTFVHRFKITDLASEKLSCMLPHVGVQVA